MDMREYNPEYIHVGLLNSMDIGLYFPRKYKIRTIARPIPNNLNDLFLNIYLI